MYRIVVAEDEAIIRDNLAHAFDWGRMGFEIVHTAANGQDALAYFRAHAADVLLTDVRMPGMDGIELMWAVKELRPQVEIVFLSGYADFAYVRSALQAHAFAYVLKLDLMKDLEPVFEQLRARIDHQRATEIYQAQIASMQALISREAMDPISQAQQYVLEHFAENLRLEDVAGRFFLSPAYFSRMFKKKLGMTFSDYVKEQRLAMAYRLLETTQLRVIDVGLEVGYRDIKYFTQLFRDRYGVLPSALRAGDTEPTGP